TNQGHNDEARRVGKETLAIADGVLEQRPGYRLALHAKQLLEGTLANLAQLALDPKDAMKWAVQSEQTSFVLLKLDPHNVTTLNNLGVAQGSIGDIEWSNGHLDESIDWYRKSLDPWAEAAKGGIGFAIVRGVIMAGLAYKQAIIGDMAGAVATVETAHPFI